MMSTEKQLSVGPSPTAKLHSGHGSPREAARKGELDALGLEKLIILEKNAEFIAQSDTVDNIMLASVKMVIPIVSFTVARPGPWGVMMQEGDAEPLAQAPREKLYHHPVKNNERKLTR